MTKAKQKLINIAILMVLILISAFFLFPLVITVTNSFMSPFEVTTRYTPNFTPENIFYRSGVMHYVRMTLIPSFVTLGQYFRLLFESPQYLGQLWNSIFLTVPVVFGQLLVSVPGAYAFELSKFKYKEAVFFVYIIVMLMPLQVTLVPNFIVADFLNIRESYLAIILPGIFNPFGIFLTRQFLKGMPKDYVESMKVDGAGHLRIIVSLIVPLIKPAIAAVLILTFVEYWNIVDQAIVFITDVQREPLSVFLSRISIANSDIIFAASAFYMLPAVLIFLFGQKNMIQGIQLSGLK
jgi:multiple sugar transport system permease protein